MTMIYQGGRMLILNDAQIRARVEAARRALLAGADGFAERKRELVTYVAPPRPRREWPVVTTVECGLRRHDNRFAEAAAHLAKAERARDDGQAALRESRRTLARAEEERDFAEATEARGRALLRRAWEWIAVGAGLAVVNAALMLFLICLSQSLALALVVVAGSGGAVLLEVERAERRRSR